MTYTKLTLDDIDRAVDLIEKKEFMTLEKTGATICVMKLRDGNYLVGANAVSTDSSDLEARYQSAFESALQEVIDVARACGPFDDCQDKPAG